VRPSSASVEALIEETVAHAIETGHVPTLVNTYFYKAIFEMVRGDAGAARRDAEMVVKLSQENALPLTAALGALLSAWADARLDGGETAATELRQALAAYNDQRKQALRGVLARFACRYRGSGRRGGTLEPDRRSASPRR